MSARAAIRVQGLVSQFDDQRIHDGLELTVRYGEILSLVGGSGTGKTVLMRTILGLQRPTAGRVEVMGCDVTGGEAPPFHRVGVVFQQGGLFSQLTVCENVAFPILRHSRVGARTARELAELKLRMSGLDASAFEKYPAELSDGMRKRASLARALSLDPDLLFLDEPTGGLDPVSATQFDALIEDLHRDLDLTVMMITHDLNTLFRISERVAVLVDGRAIVGTLDEILARDEPWIREYFGSARARAARRLGEAPVDDERHEPQG
jgi:phospholipid/cholesterol/gamma-HCH transport system ATP-binding protein